MGDGRRGRVGEQGGLGVRPRVVGGGESVAVYRGRDVSVRPPVLPIVSVPLLVAGAVMLDLRVGRGEGETVGHY